LLDINGHVSGGCLHLNWNYSKEVHREETIQSLADDCMNELRTVLGHCRTAEGSFTPSDFPLARITQGELDRILRNRQQHQESHLR